MHCPTLQRDEMLTSSADTTYGSLVNVTCKIGYLFGDGTSTKVVVCDGDETWGVPDELLYCQRKYVETEMAMCEVSTSM